MKARERVAAARGVARARVLGHEQNREGAGHSERQRSSSELREALMVRVRRERVARASYGSATEGIQSGDTQACYGSNINYNKNAGFARVPWTR